MSLNLRPRWMAAATLTCAALAMTSCGGSSSKPAGQGTGAALVGTVQPVALGALTPQDIGSAQTAFGLDLLAERCTADPTGNDVLSPASAALALSMLDTGAAGSTREALSKLLHLPAWSPQLIAALHDQHQALTTLQQLKVSNRIYTQLGIHPQQQVLDDLATAEGAGLQTLDFAGDPAKATDVINQHVDEDTKGLIKKLFDDPLDPSTTTVLTDALYLDAAWQTPFEPAVNAGFHTAAGSTVTVPLMSSAEGVGQLRRSAGWTSVTLPYAGGKLEAVVMLPTSPSASWCAAVTPQQLATLTTGPSGATTIQLPKLDLSQTSDLTQNLASLGLPLAGDYTGFGAQASVYEIIQKTVLQMDEHGTKAAAATGIATLSVSTGLGVTVNRPYLLLIRDTVTGTPLFLARIADPAAAS